MKQKKNSIYEQSVLRVSPKALICGVLAIWLLNGVALFTEFVYTFGLVQPPLGVTILQACLFITSVLISIAVEVTGFYALIKKYDDTSVGCGIIVLLVLASPPLIMLIVAAFSFLT